TGWPAAARTCARPRHAPPSRPRRRAPGRRRDRSELHRPGSRAAAATTRPPGLGDRGCPASAARAPSPSPQHHLRVAEAVVEVDLRQPLERVDVARARAGDDLVRQLRAWVDLVPPKRLAVVARVLLVEGRLRAARAVAVRRPEAR